MNGFSYSVRPVVYLLRKFFLLSLPILGDGAVIAVTVVLQALILRKQKKVLSGLLVRKFRR